MHPSKAGQVGYDLRVAIQNISEKVKTQPVERSAIKEIITEEKTLEIGKVVRTVHA